MRALSACGIGGEQKHKQRRHYALDRLLLPWDATSAQIQPWLEGICGLARFRVFLLACASRFWILLHCFWLGLG